MVALFLFTTNGRAIALALAPVDTRAITKGEVCGGVSRVRPCSSGALLPALGGGPAGVVGAGVVFGALHAGGGRNAAFAAWAGVVGGGA